MQIKFRKLLSETLKFMKIRSKLKRIDSVWKNWLKNGIILIRSQWNAPIDKFLKFSRALLQKSTKHKLFSSILSVRVAEHAQNRYVGKSFIGFDVRCSLFWKSRGNHRVKLSTWPRVIPAFFLLFFPHRFHVLNVFTSGESVPV